MSDDMNPTKIDTKVLDNFKFEFGSTKTDNGTDKTMNDQENGIKTYELETGITLDYRQDRWGLERLVLDTISNHLPEDSKGTRVRVKLKQDEQYVDLKQADPNKKTQEIIFEDDGIGYDPRLLKVLFSTKTAEGGNVGQFGEGSKMVAAAALRNNIDLEYQSRNWTATPDVKEEEIDGHRIKNLKFRIKENGHNIQGSRTVIKAPSGDLMIQIESMPEKVLYLKQEVKSKEEVKDKWTYRVLSTHIPSSSTIPFEIRHKVSDKYHNRIIEVRNGIDEPTNSDVRTAAIFVKGIRMNYKTALFDYDLGLKDISPDRFYTNHETVRDLIGSMLKETESIEVIATILKEAAKNPYGRYIEFQALEDRFAREHRNYFEKQGSDSFESDFSIRRNLFFKEDNSCIVDTSHTKIYKISERTIHDFESPIKSEKVKPNLWFETFKKLYGENAILASKEESLNEDARIQGFTTISLNDNVSKYLARLGIKEVDKIIKKNTETWYKWLDQKELTLEERTVLERVPELTRYMLGTDELVDVRVYESKYVGDKPIPEELGTTFIEDYGRKKYIGIKRSQLADVIEFADTYIHELGHYVTKQGNHNGRGLIDFFTRKLAREAVENTKKKD